MLGCKNRTVFTKNFLDQNSRNQLFQKTKKVFCETNLSILRCLLDQLVVLLQEYFASFLLLHSEQLVQVHPLQIDRLSVRVALVADLLGDLLRQVSQSGGLVRRHQRVRDHDTARLRSRIEFGLHLVAGFVAFGLVQAGRRQE